MIESKQMCLSHKCDECGKELHTDVTKIQHAFMTVFFLLFVGGIWLADSQSNKINSNSYCFIRVQTGDFFMSKDVVCPK